MYAHRPKNGDFAIVGSVMDDPFHLVDVATVLYSLEHVTRDKMTAVTHVHLENQLLGRVLIDGEIEHDTRWVYVFLENIGQQLSLFTPYINNPLDLGKERMWRDGTQGLRRPHRHWRAKDRSQFLICLETIKEPRPWACSNAISPDTEGLAQRSLRPTGILAVKANASLIGIH